MTITNGAGVDERQEDWTCRTVFEDWIADKKLSRRKLAWLEATYRDFMHTMQREGAFSPTVAPSWMRDELDSKHLIYEIQCVADLLDFLKPKKEGITREQEIFGFLDSQGHL